MCVDRTFVRVHRLNASQFTAPDLSLLAENLDNLEGSHLDEQATESRNMDDTGRLH